MKKANTSVLLHFKRLPWLLLPASFTINSALFAAEYLPANENHYSETSLTGTMTEILNNMPLNALAWISLSAIMAILFFSKQQANKQVSASNVRRAG